MVSTPREYTSRAARFLDPLLRVAHLLNHEICGLPALHWGPMRTITLEEHFASPAFMEGPGRRLRERAAISGSPSPRLFEQLCDLGEKRIAEMDAARIDVQVLSLTAPGVQQLDPAEAVEISRESNDHLARAVQKNKGRFFGFAQLPTAVPDTAVAE